MLSGENMGGSSWEHVLWLSGQEDQRKEEEEEEEKGEEEEKEAEAEGG